MDAQRPHLLPSVELTESGRPVFLSGETECSILDSVDVESIEIPNFHPLRSGLLTLTTHRLIWIEEKSSQRFGYAIPLSTAIQIYPPEKSIKKIFSNPKLRIQVSVSENGRVEEKGRRSAVIKFVIKSKTDPELFIGRMWEVMRARAWEIEEKSNNGASGSSNRGSSSEGSVGVRTYMAGVSGILRKEQEQWESTERSLNDAFQDLDALMANAKDMVKLADTMRAKLLSGSGANAGPSNDEDTPSNQDMQDWLLSVGFVSPVTKETAGALYHQQLSRQLSDFVKEPLKRAGGMLALIDAYCLFNRARGTELISPEDMLQACAIWDKIDLPVRLRKYESGVMIIQNKSHSDAEVLNRIEQIAVMPDALKYGISASDAARALGIAPALAKEQLLTAENKGLLCRDVSFEGLRFYVNLFREIHADRHNLDGGLLGKWCSATAAVV